MIELSLQSQIVHFALVALISHNNMQEVSVSSSRDLDNHDFLPHELRSIKGTDTRHLILLLPPLKSSTALEQMCNGHGFVRAMHSPAHAETDESLVQQPQI